MAKRPSFPFLVVFFLVSILFIGIMLVSHIKQALFYALFFGNLVLYIATTVSYHFNKKGIGNNNVQAFLRMVYSGMFLKMGICLVAVIVYALFFKPISIAAVLVFFVLYFVYTILEVRILMAQNKE